LQWLYRRQHKVNEFHPELPGFKIPKGSNPFIVAHASFIAALMPAISLGYLIE